MILLLKLFTHAVIRPNDTLSLEKIFSNRVHDGEHIAVTLNYEPIMLFNNQPVVQFVHGVDHQWSIG